MGQGFGHCETYLTVQRRKKKKSGRNIGIEELQPAQVPVAIHFRSPYGALDLILLQQFGTFDLQEFD